MDWIQRKKNRRNSPYSFQFGSPCFSFFGKSLPWNFEVTWAKENHLVLYSWNELSQRDEWMCEGTVIHKKWSLYTLLKTEPESEWKYRIAYNVGVSVPFLVLIFHSLSLLISFYWTLPLPWNTSLKYYILAQGKIIKRIENRGSKNRRRVKREMIKGMIGRTGSKDRVKSWGHFLLVFVLFIPLDGLPQIEIQFSQVSFHDPHLREQSSHSL